MPHGEEPIGQWKSKIVRVEFDEGSAQHWRTAEAQCECISFKLKVSTENSHTERQQLKHKQQVIFTVNTQDVLQ